jgi:hypothetical protein
MKGLFPLVLICVAFHWYFSSMTQMDEYYLLVGLVHWTMVCGDYRGPNMVGLEYELRCLIYYNE